MALMMSDMIHELFKINTPELQMYWHQLDLLLLRTLELIVCSVC